MHLWLLILNSLIIYFETIDAQIILFDQISVFNLLTFT